MRLNHKKSHIMNFKFTRNYQFSTRIQMEGQTLPVLNQSKLLVEDSKLSTLNSEEENLVSSN